ncbi:MAG: HTTM domain-containing protein, partial [Bdellovibrionales bacterium]
DSLIGKFPDREFLYGSNGLITPASTMSYFQGAELEFNVLHLVPTADPQLMLFFIALIGATLCLTAGLFTRLSSIVVFLGLLALGNRGFLADNAGDDLIRIFSFFLIFAPAGAAFSLDRWWRVKTGIEGKELVLRSPWAQRLLQLQFAYVYLDTVFLKAHGMAWLDGTALYYALNYVELKRFE